MDTNSRKTDGFAERLLLMADEIISVLRALEKGARDLRRTVSKAS